MYLSADISVYTTHIHECKTQFHINCIPDMTLTNKHQQKHQTLCKQKNHANTRRVSAVITSTRWFNMISNTKLEVGMNAGGVDQLKLIPTIPFSQLTGEESWKHLMSILYSHGRDGDQQGTKYHNGHGPNGKKLSDSLSARVDVLQRWWVTSLPGQTKGLLKL